MFGLVRRCCGEAAVTQLDEANALRTEVGQVRDLPLSSARALDEAALNRQAERPRRELMSKGDSNGTRRRRG